MGPTCIIEVVIECGTNSSTLSMDKKIHVIDYSIVQVPFLIGAVFNLLCSHSLSTDVLSLHVANRDKDARLYI